MDIRLNSLKIQNFKGIKELSIKAEGRDLNIYGSNNTGKTTIIDAVTWLLFDKNSQDRADTSFTLKPQDEEGQDINHLTTLVEAEFLLDDQPTKIKKTREEKWVKRHGETERVFDGHTKSYWFNEVPLKANPFKAKINELINEDIFKMITNPLHFNTKLSWQERREILLQMSGDLTNEQVINSSEELSSLTELLTNRTVDEYKMVLADQLKGYRKERDNIPPRIDELTLTLPQQEPEYEAISIEVEEIKNKLSAIEKELTSTTDSKRKVDSKYQKLAKLKNNLLELKEAEKEKLSQGRTKALESKSRLLEGQYSIKSSIELLEKQAEGLERKLVSNSTTRERLLNTWRSLSDEDLGIRTEEFAEEVENTCPTCKQDLPQEDIENKLDTLRENFEKEKVKKIKDMQLRIKDNKNEGIALKADTEKTEKELESLRTKLIEEKEQLKLVSAQLEEVEALLKEPIAEPDYTKNKDIIALNEEIESLTIELGKPVEDESAELVQEREALQTKLSELNKELNKKEQIERTKERITELKSQESNISIKIAELEGKQYLLDQFIVRKVDLLEESINNKFNHVKFKLFEENITNEGIKEACIALVNTNGSYVKFEDANSAGQINSGIDIINSLCDFYEVSSPIFIDNRESVVNLADTDSQVISLFVSGEDKALRVEAVQ